MSLYKIDRSRTISYKGKFKFDYTIDLTSSGASSTQVLNKFSSTKLPSNLNRHQ